MKTLAAIFTILSLSFGTSYGITHFVTVQNNSYSPSSFSVDVGDTVLWQWVAGIHTTSSVSVPGGASTWSGTLNSSNKFFTYVVTELGSYSYQCNIHGSGMSGGFTASVTGIDENHSGQNTLAISQVFPNPFQTFATLRITGVITDEIEFSLYDISGRILLSKSIALNYSGETILPINVPGNNIPDGTYFYVARFSTFGSSFIKSCRGKVLVTH
ncbi:MAG: T9SS type A sorting domain-containing protein [Bacteroidetes bacterium]|nr:T9SS type A sorting domain-containing protein [Bacteroidota bacterium]